MHVGLPKAVLCFVVFKSDGSKLVFEPFAVYLHVGTHFIERAIPVAQFHVDKA